MVNRIVYILCLLVFAGCTRDDDAAGSDGATVPVTFSVAGISVSADTRTGETISSGTPFEIVACLHASPTDVVAAGNYTADGSGALTPTSGTDMNLTPGNYDFYVYTKSGTVARASASMDVTDIPHGMDFYAGSATVDISVTPAVPFGELERLCSKLTFSISCASDKNFTMNSITINKIATSTTATYALGGSMTVPSAGASDTYTLFGSGNFSGNGTDAVTTGETIILPVTVSGGYTLTFNTTIDGVATAFTADLTTPTPNFAGGNQYNYTVTLADMVKITMQVKDWEEPEKWEASIGAPVGTYLEGSNSYIINPMPGREQIFYIPIEWAVDAISEAKRLNSSVLDFPATWIAEVLWQTWQAGANTTLTFGEHTHSDGKKYIKVTVPGGIVAGNNAVVALRNATGGTVYWSWHLWITDYEPLPAKGVAYCGELHQYAGAAFTSGIYKGKYIMDRNLGATWTATDGLLIAATMTSGTAVTDVIARKAYGLMYQWGRKDPFPGYNGGTTYTVGSVTVYNGTGGTATSHSYSATTPATNDNNLAAAIKNPTIHYYASTTGNDWYTNTHTTRQNALLWGDATDKSPFDPCPPGWRVPLGGTDANNNPWIGFTAATAATNNFVRYYNGSAAATRGNTAGRLYSGNGDGNKAWYPAAGWRAYNSGAFVNNASAVGSFGLYGHYWSATYDTTSPYYGYNLYFSQTLIGTVVTPANAVSTASNHYRAYGMPVRCIQQ